LPKLSSAAKVSAACRGTTAFRCFALPQYPPVVFHSQAFRRKLHRKEFPLLALIQAAGWPIYPLLLASVIALALIFERLMVLRRQRILPPGLLEQVLNSCRQGTITPQSIEQLEQDSPLGRILAAGLRNARNTREASKEAIEEAGRQVAHGLERFLNTLGTIASISPLMGLFGTVIGMIEIFGANSPTGTNPQQLAHGISVALYNTGLGIFIAVPAMIMFRYFRGAVEGFVVEMERAASRLVDLTHGAGRGNSQ